MEFCSQLLVNRIVWTDDDHSMVVVLRASMHRSNLSKISARMSSFSICPRLFLLPSPPPVFFEGYSTVQSTVHNRMRERERAERKIIIVDMYIVISSSSIEWVSDAKRGASRLHRLVFLVASRGSFQCSSREGERETDVAIFSISTQMTIKFVLRPTDKRSLLIVALLDYLIGQPVKREKKTLTKEATTE
jgi:hypothetical protein